MIRHTLFVRFSTATTPPERDALLMALILLCDRVGEVDSFACGPNVDYRSREGGYTHAFTILFGTKEAHDAFLGLPDYAAAYERLLNASEVVEFAE